jgi:hypothetical protein
MESQAGVLLDELPAGTRDQVAEALLARPESFWRELAQRQVRLTGRRLNFRNFVYENKGQLPLPPEELWSIQLDQSGPARQSIQGHDLVAIDYVFNSTLLTDDESPAASEPALTQIGGTWEEPFILPVDPDLLLQRTGNACLNEAGFPPTVLIRRTPGSFTTIAARRIAGAYRAATVANCPAYRAWKRLNSAPAWSRRKCVLNALNGMLNWPTMFAWAN